MPISTGVVGVNAAGGFILYVPPGVVPTPSGAVSTMGTGVTDGGDFLRYVPPAVIPEPKPPVNVTAPAASATSLAQGGMAVTTNGTWDGLTPRTYTYQWQVVGGAAIPGATAQTWTIAGYEGDMIQCVVTATNADGSASATSNAVGPIEVTEPPPA